MIIKDWEYNNFIKSISNYKATLIHGSDRGKVTEKCNELLNSLSLAMNNSIEIRELLPDELINSKYILHEIAYQRSFFSKLIIIRINLDLIRADKEIIDFFDKLENAKSNFFIIETSYLKSHDPLLKIFVKRKNYAVFTCYQDTKKNINITISKYLKRYSLTIDKNCLSYLSDRLGNDTLITKNEIKKLALFAGNKKVSLEDILDAFGDNSVINVFSLCDSLGISNLSKINYLYDIAKQNGANYILILRSILNHIIMLTSLKERKVRDIKSIKSSVHFSRHEMINQQLIQLSIDKLRSYIPKVHKTEVECKINPHISDILLKKIILDFSIY